MPENKWLVCSTVQMLYESGSLSKHVHGETKTFVYIFMWISIIDDGDKVGISNEFSSSPCPVPRWFSAKIEKNDLWPCSPEIHLVSYTRVQFSLDHRIECSVQRPTLIWCRDRLERKTEKSSVGVVLADNWLKLLQFLQLRAKHLSWRKVIMFVHTNCGSLWTG